MNQIKLIVGNWKMNPGTLGEAKRIIRKIRRVAMKMNNIRVVVCPPTPFIVACVARKKPDPIHFGAQKVTYVENTASTGEVDAVMLRDIGVKYVIIGHSEQRALGDTDEMVSKRVLACLKAGLTPIVCVGEKERDDNGDFLEPLKEQIKKSFAGIPKKYSHNVIVAYEPIWKIGEKEAMIPDQVCEMAIFIRKVFSDIFGNNVGLKLKVLYGGSVNFRNATGIIQIGKVDGFLIGRESVNTPGFIELMKAVDSIS